MKSKKHVPIFLSAILAVFGIVVASKNLKEGKGDYATLAAQVDLLAVTAHQEHDVALETKDFKACVITASVEGLIHATSQSLANVGSGTCLLPDVSVDVTACIPLRPTTPVVTASSGVATALNPTLLLVGSLSGNMPDKTKKWVKGTTEWLHSGVPSIEALLADPSSGKFVLKGVTIEGCPNP